MPDEMSWIFVKNEVDILGAAEPKLSFNNGEKLSETSERVHTSRYLAGLIVDSETNCTFLSLPV